MFIMNNILRLIDYHSSFYSTVLWVPLPRKYVRLKVELISLKVHVLKFTNPLEAPFKNQLLSLSPINKSGVLRMLDFFDLFYHRLFCREEKKKKEKEEKVRLI